MHVKCVSLGYWIMYLVVHIYRQGRCAAFGINHRLLTFLLDELVEKAGFAHTSIANHQKLEQVICTRSKHIDPVKLDFFIATVECMSPTIHSIALTWL